MVKVFKRFVWLLVAASVVGVVAYASTKEPVRDLAKKSFGGGKRAGGTSGTGDLPTPVLAGTAELRDIAVYLEGVGTARALNIVTVKPQIDGRLLRIAFKEGQSVKKGDLLAEIDPATYRAQLDQATAKKALTEVQLANARRDMQRYQSVAKGVIAQKTMDTQEAQVAQLEAQIKADVAAIANTQAILDYTRILAPIDGRTGLRLVDEGNVVRGADAGIVTITQVQPISVVFTLPQQQLPQVSKAMAGGVLGAIAMDTDNRLELDTGTLQVIDNQIDQTTGTVRMKADFANASLQLWPGQFVNVRLLVATLKQVVVVPTPAVQRGPNGTFVYVIGAEGRVAVKLVTLVQQTEAEAVIATGIAAGERVVTTGFSRLTDNARVAVGTAIDPKVPMKPAAAAAADGAAAKGDGTGERKGEGIGEGKGEGKGRRDRPADPTAGPPAGARPAGSAPTAAVPAKPQGSTQ